MSCVTLLNKASLGVLYFGTYSLLGWLLEVSYHLIMQQHFVNPGFLHGPFLPIYGSFCLLVITAEKPLTHLSWVWHFAFFIAATTLLEYFTGWYFWQQLHIQLWNYDDIPFNYNGFVALPFSVAWGILGLVFEQVIQPLVKAKLSSISLNFRLCLASLFVIYLLGDISYSLILATRLNTIISQFHSLFDLFQQASIYFAQVITLVLLPV